MELDSFAPPPSSPHGPPPVVERHRRVASEVVNTAVARLRPPHMPRHAATTHVHRPSAQLAPVPPDPPACCHALALAVTGGGAVTARGG
jgi:hypothetical protein